MPGLYDGLYLERQPALLNLGIADQPLPAYFRVLVHTQSHSIPQLPQDARCL